MKNSTSDASSSEDEGGHVLGVDLGVTREFTKKWDKTVRDMDRTSREMAIHALHGEARLDALNDLHQDDVARWDAFFSSEPSLSDRAKEMLESRPGTCVTGLALLGMAFWAARRTPWLVGAGASLTMSRVATIATSLPAGMGALGVSLTATPNQLAQWHSSGAGRWFYPSGQAIGIAGTLLGVDSKRIRDAQEKVGDLQQFLEKRKPVGY